MIQQRITTAMNQITIISILQKIRSICKECCFPNIPEHRTSDSTRIQLEPFLGALEQIRLQVIKYHTLEEEYQKLEEVLQKQETEIRKKIGVEQQLKLYTETLKMQVEELEKEKLDLLENSKSYIKELKKTNESLFSQLHLRTHSKRPENTKSNSPARNELNKHNKSTSHTKPNHDRSIKQIIKTQYIDRERSGSAYKKKYPKKARFGVQSTLSGQSHDCKETSKTFQVVEDPKKKRGVASKKKNKNVFSNFTLLNFLESSHKKLKKEEKNGRSGKKEGQRGQFSNMGLSRDKKINKSIFSVVSMEQQAKGKKETI